MTRTKSKGLFITGTGTDVGKTYVSAALVRHFRRKGVNVGYYKVALSGAEFDPTERKWIPLDASYVCRHAGLSLSPEKLVSYIYKTPVSPHLAARREGNPAEWEKILNDYNRLADDFDYITVEGSGGIISPVRYDDVCQIFWEDIIRRFDLDVAVVADAGLGTINAAVLTAEYLKSRNIVNRGFIINRFRRGNFLDEDNCAMIERLTHLPILTCIEENAEELFSDADSILDCYR